MRKLTIGEEIRVLKSLRSAEVMDSGSSRIVFDCSDEIAIFLRLNTEKDYVVKLAVGHGGFIQNTHEINTYSNYDTNYFAEIAAFGHFVIIMEKVDTDDYRSFADTICWDDDPTNAVEDWCEYNWEDADDDDRRSLCKAAKTIIYLANIYGCTSDNGQLGLTSDGRFVAYDFGFYASDGCSAQCSRELLDNIVCNEESFGEYTNKLINILHEIDHIGCELDKVLLKVHTAEAVMNAARR